MDDAVAACAAFIAEREEFHVAKLWAEANPWEPNQPERVARARALCDAVERFSRATVRRAVEREGAG